MGITWTKTWSSASDGEVLTGAQLGTLQSDIAGKFAESGSGIADADVKGTIKEAKILFATGGHGHSGGTDGKAVGGAVSCISRGFELVFNTTGAVNINPGTLYHNTTQVNKTASTTLTLITDADWIDGSQPASLASDIFYVYSDSSGNFKLEETAPGKADISGNTVGTLYYHLEGSTYYFIIGAVVTNSSSQIIKFYQRGNWIYYDDPQHADLLAIDITSNVTTWTAKSCVTWIPTISSLIKLNYQMAATNSAYAQFRVTGSSATVGTKIGPSPHTGVSALGLGGTVEIPTDSSQSFDYKAAFDDGDFDAWIYGYQLDTRL